MCRDQARLVVLPIPLSRALCYDGITGMEEGGADRPPPGGGIAMAQVNIAEVVRAIHARTLKETGSKDAAYLRCAAWLNGRVLPGTATSIINAAIATA